MGYSTNYKLNYSGNPINNLAGWLDEVTGYDWDDSLELPDVKWYDHHNDMVKISKMFPSELFTLEGEGEESGDIWKAYYKNGLCQDCPAKITFDEFDEGKLK